MRAFIAVDVPGASDVLDVAGAGPRAPEHITLRFLGEIDAVMADAISQRLAEVARLSAPFDLTVAGIGGFPNLERPRIIFAPVREGRSDVEGLAARVESAVRVAGVAPERRPFVAHLTLLRVRSPKDRERARRLTEVLQGATVASTRVTELLFKRSDLTPSGAIHQVIGRFPLLGL